MSASASPPRFAVFGQPIAHSLSPRIHQAFATACGIALRYDAIEMAPEDFPERLAQLHREGLRGANVTLPLKELAAQLCDALSPAARLSGAVNTLVRRDGGWLGDNTDGTGLCRDVSTHLGTSLQGTRVLLLGAGGAARGVVPALFDAGVRELLVANRTPERAATLAQDLASCGTITACTLGELAQAGSFDVVLNATSATRHGEALALPNTLFTPKALAYDLSYGASAQPFLTWARQAGAHQTADGLGMLVEQAAEAFQRWHGIRPETANVLLALRK